MGNISVTIKKNRRLPGQAPMEPRSPFDCRSGFFGMVTAVHPETNTVDVRMDTGREICYIRVASFQWVTIDKNKDYLTGQRRLPPVDTFVYCLMPTGEPSSAIVLCSAFAMRDPMGGSGGIAEFKEDSADAAFIEKTIDGGGWKFTHDTRSGTRKIQNAPKDGDETVSLETDQEEDGKEKITLAIHGNTFTVDKDNGIKVETDKNIEFAVKGNATFKVDGDIAAEVKGKTEIKSTGDVKIDGSANVDAKGVNVTIEASATLTLKSGDAAAWMPNCVPACPWGMPHGGPGAGIAKLKGG